MHNIPLQDIKSQNKAIKDFLIKDFKSVLNTGNFVSSSNVENFENNFAKFCNSNFVIGCSSGTSALRIALKALGIKSGDKVIIPSMTFVATAEAVISIGATPVLIDVDNLSWTLDSNKLNAYITSEIKCVIPVHLHGRLAEMKEILDISSEYQIPVLEDSAQAHGAKRGNFQSGSSGKIAAFSFYPGKNLGALGEAGAITTNDPTLAESCFLLRNWGTRTKYVHEFPGSNERMDEIQGAFLKTKLNFLENWTLKRIEAANFYFNLFKDTNIKLPFKDESKHVYHIFAIRVKNRDQILKELHKKGIMAGIHYARPIHLQPAYSKYCIRGSDLSISEKLGEEFISLPLWENITQNQMKYIANTVIDLNHKYNE